MKICDDISSADFGIPVGDVWQSLIVQVQSSGGGTRGIELVRDNKRK